MALLSDARKHVDKYPSVAEDTGQAERTAKHFMQRVLNRVAAELSPEAAAAGGNVAPEEAPLKGFVRNLRKLAAGTHAKYLVFLSEGSLLQQRL